jgi:hypothetical protein
MNDNDSRQVIDIDELRQIRRQAESDQAKAWLRTIRQQLAQAGGSKP